MQDAATQNPQVIVSLANVTKQFKQMAVPAVVDLSLQLYQGEILALLGPSGCGKTTLLRLIAGFELPDQGTIAIAGQTVFQPGRSLPPEQRGVGMVFQDYALFPHLTVGDNVAFGLHQLRKSGIGIKARVMDVLALVGLSSLAHRYPYQLSGGQQQRVALARALAPRPALVLLDEPLSNLDVQVRAHLRQELRQILKTAGTSALFVTHDQEEALILADRVGVMRRGSLEQCDRPESVYYAPKTRFVAEFVTQANLITGHRTGEQWHTEIGTFALQNSPGGDRAEIMIRPEAIAIVPDPNGSAIVTSRQFLGREQRYTLELQSGRPLQVRTTAEQSVAIGTRVNLTINQSQFYGFAQV